MDAMQLLRTRYSALRLGEPAPSPEDDLIVGFIYVGTDIGGRGVRSERSIDDFAEHWTGAAAR